MGDALVEFRGQTQVELPLPAGPHPVSFGDFNGKTTWFSGTVTVVAGQVTELQFDKHATPLAMGTPERYVAD